MPYIPLFDSILCSSSHWIPHSQYCEMCQTIITFMTGSDKSGWSRPCAWGVSFHQPPHPITQISLSSFKLHNSNMQVLLCIRHCAVKIPPQIPSPSTGYIQISHHNDQPPMLMEWYPLPSFNVFYVSRKCLNLIKNEVPCFVHHLRLLCNFMTGIL